MLTNLIHDDSFQQGWVFDQLNLRIRRETTEGYGHHKRNLISKPVRAPDSANKDKIHWDARTKVLFELGELRST